MEVGGPWSSLSWEYYENTNPGVTVRASGASVEVRAEVPCCLPAPGTEGQRAGERYRNLGPCGKPTTGTEA